MRCQFTLKCGDGCYRCKQCWQVVQTTVLPIYAMCRGYRGAGYYLSRSLSWFGLSANKTCKCRIRARLMDDRGVDWCAANQAEIVGWLREAAEERGLPFVEAAACGLVRRAIRSARKAAAKAAKNRPS